MFLTFVGNMTTNPPHPHSRSATVALALALALVGCKSTPAPTPTSAANPTPSPSRHLSPTPDRDPCRLQGLPLLQQQLHPHHPRQATDDEIAALVWQLRDATRTHTLDKLKISQKDADAGSTTWFHIYRGTKCASEKFTTGKLPCEASYHATGDYTYSHQARLGPRHPPPQRKRNPALGPRRPLHSANPSPIATSQSKGRPCSTPS